VEYFDGLVDGLRNHYGNVDWERQAIGGISMGGYLAFEIAARRAAANEPFRSVGLFSAVLQLCDNLQKMSQDLVNSPPRLLYLQWQEGDDSPIIQSNNQLIENLGKPKWLLDSQEPNKKHNWFAWRPQIQHFLKLLPPVLAPEEADAGTDDRAAASAIDAVTAGVGPEPVA
jgi:S-formylglutathione hydrolase FrmB